MTTNAIQRTQLPAALTQAGRIGQATAVEQSRAIAEVQAAVVMAHEFPRSIDAATQAMDYSCRKTALAEQAFYSFKRGGQSVNGSTIHLARELARVWRNIDYGIAELRRDDEHGQSEMQAMAWDLETNTRVTSVFIVPHKRDTKDGAKQLVDMRDIYENNANNGARRLRECIYAVLPKWFVTEAEQLCRETLAGGGGVSLADRITNAVNSFRPMKVSVAQLEARIGKPRSEWTADDVAQLGIDYQTISRGEAKPGDLFAEANQGQDTADGIKAQAQRQQPPAPQAPAEPTAAEPEPPADAEQPEPPVEPVDQAQLKRLHTLLTKCGVPADQKHRDVSTLVGRPIESTKDLTRDEAETVIAKLADCARGDEPALELEQVLDELRRADAEQGGAQ